MRGTQLSRQWLILRQIETSHNGLTAAKIAKITGVSINTAYRDLDGLERAGFPLVTEKTEKGRCWKFVETHHFNIPQPFSYTELMSLHMSRDMFEVLKGTVFFDSLESVFQKLEATIPPETKAYLDRVQSTFQVGISPYKNYRRYRNIVDKINQAVLEQRRIEILYLPLRSKKETHRKIDPYGIRLFEGTIYFIGFCHLRKNVRTFVVDRIRLLGLTEEKFQRPVDFDLEEYTRHSFRVVQGKLHTINIRISPAWARYVGEKTWHRSQQIRKLPDKSLELTLRVAGLNEIKQWVLSLGPEAKVIAPKRLKEMVKQDLRKTLLMYLEAGKESRPGRFGNHVTTGSKK